MELNLRGRVAIVTGASRGLGRSAARALADEGVRVLGIARSRSQLEELQIESPGLIEVAECDMRDLDRVSEIPRLAFEQFGGLDIVVNNAGIAPASEFLSQDWQTWEDVLRINVTAPAVLAREAGVLLRERGAGKIVNIASTCGLRGKAQLAAYSASKGALIRFTEALAAEWAPFNVQVNAIAPGAFETDAQRAVTSNPEVLARRIRKIPAGRLGQVNEFAPLVCLLASSASGFITGATFVIDGGEVSKL